MPTGWRLQFVYIKELGREERILHSKFRIKGELLKSKYRQKCYHECIRNQPCKMGEEAFTYSVSFHAPTHWKFVPQKYQTKTLLRSPA